MSNPDAHCDDRDESSAEFHFTDSVIVRMQDMPMQFLPTGEEYLSEIIIMDDEESGNIVIQLSNEKFPSRLTYSNVVDFKREWKFMPLNYEQEVKQ